MLIIVYPQKKMLIIVAVNCHIGALLASAPLKPGVPPGGEASWAMGEQWKLKEQERPRGKGAGCGVSRAGAAAVTQLSQCVWKRHPDSIRFFCVFF